jgi:hypothetical protein
VYVFGGYTGATSQYLDDLLAFNSTSNEWIRVFDVSTTRYDNPGPFGRSWSYWSLQKTANDRSLLMYGGCGSSDGRKGASTDGDKRDFWRLNVRNNSGSIPTWQAVITPTCLTSSIVCDDQLNIPSRDAAISRYLLLS